MKRFVQPRLAGRTGLVLAGLAILAAGLLPPPARASDTVYYYSSDALHSEVVITDQNRNVVERTHYAPYGQVLNRSLRDGPGYTGHAEDPGTGLVYMQQRYYDPVAGRFLSADPVQADPRSGTNFNRYEYANDNPYRYIDPDGRSFWDFHQHASGCTLGNRFACSHGWTKRGHSSRENSSRPAGQCNLDECTRYRQMNRQAMHDGFQAVEQAGKFGAKKVGEFVLWSAVGHGIGRIAGKLKGLARFLGFASEDAGPAFRADTSHIFRQAPGHLAEDTVANRALLRGAVNPDNLVGARGPGGSISVYRETLPDGRQVWVEVRNGTEITNGGVNDPPR